MTDNKAMTTEKMTDDKANEEKIEDLCKDCGPAFAAFLEQMAEHNKEQVAELGAQPNNAEPDKNQTADLHSTVVCPTCGKVREYTFPFAPKAAGLAPDAGTGNK